MNERIQNLTGTTVITVDGKKHKLGKVVGYGAQGVVFEDGTGDKVIKLYYPTGSKLIDEDILERLRFISKVKTPSNFIKIEEIVDNPYIGYVMEKVVDFKPLNTYLIPNQEISFSDWYNKGFGLRERLIIGYVIAKAFEALERSNLSYCDISGKNILVNTEKNAAVKMIDVDNIYTAGKGVATVLGTPRYIAPEVISRQKNPDVLSDNYSLAVILFELLRVGHPYISDEILDGTPEDEEAALAGQYDYVTDDNSTNMLPADIVLTDKLKKLFYRCFVDGKKNRMLRPSAQEFEFALLEASNKLIKCTSCGAWHYPRKTDGEFECPWCDAPSKHKAILNFYDVLTEGSSYKTGKIIDENIRGKLVNTYILKEGANNIKSFYVLRYDDPIKASRDTDNYLMIVKDSIGYWAYNKYGQDGIVIRKLKTGQYTIKSEKGTATERCKSGDYINLNANEAIQLENGDQIYFELNVNITVGGKIYSFIKMARFLEEAR